MIYLGIHSGGRSPSTITKIIKQKVPAGSDVIGDYKYFYSLLENGCEYRSLSSISASKEPGDIFIKKFQPQYIITSKDLEELQNMFQGLSKKIIKVEPVAFLNEDKELIVKIFDKLQYKVTIDYQGYLYHLSDS